MKKLLLAIALLTVTSAAVLAEPPPSADKVMAEVELKATAEHKAVFLHFGASWCSWCKRLDGFLDRPDIKPVFEKYFVPVKLYVQEHYDKKDLENAGADKLMEKLGGSGSGLPYFAFLSASGEPVANSKNDGNNIGYPGDPGEIDYFLKIRKKAAPQLTDADLHTIETALRSFKRA